MGGMLMMMMVVKVMWWMTTKWTMRGGLKIGIKQSPQAQRKQPKRGIDCQHSQCLSAFQLNSVLILNSKNVETNTMM